MKIWFLLQEGQVSGPFDRSEIETALNSKTSRGDILIWGRGQAEWLKPDKWRNHLNSDASQNNSHGKGSPDKTQQEKWQIRVEGKEHPPMDYDSLMAALRKIKDFSAVDLRPSSSSHWKEIYSVQKVVDDLGISRRAHPRVPVMGSLTIEKKDDLPQVVKVISISEGGLGVNEARDLKIGQKFSGILESPNLFVTISSTLEVVYVGQDGYAGLKFVGLPEESKSSIIEYVKKFST